MKVSVIVAAYNIEKYIEKCLTSIINQTLKDVEIIVVNDGSSDKTLDYIENICLQDKRVKVIDKKNEGLIEARKSGLEVATGEYLLFVDGDDWIEVNALEKLYSKGCEENYDIVMYNAFWCYEDRREERNTYSKVDVIQSDPLKSLFNGTIMPGIVFKFVKNKFLTSEKIEFPKSISFGEDLATVSNWFMNNPKIGLVEENLYNYYQREESISKKINKKVLEIDSAIEFIKNQLEANNIYNEYKEEFEHMVFGHLFMCRFLCVENLDQIHKKVYNQFKSRNIEIYRNKYIIENIMLNPLSFRVRVRLYNLNYYFGRTYDCIRGVLKFNSLK